MTQPTILVTGATGKTGGALISQLRERNWPVRALVHASDSRSDRLQQLGAEVVVADLFEVDQIRQAMQGTHRAYYCPPVHPDMIQAATAFTIAARDAKLEAVVGLSQWLASPDHPSLHTRQVWLVERMLAMIPGVAHINLNPGFFADNYLRLIDFASLLGIYPLMASTGRNAPPSNEDIARVAAALLMDPERHAGRSYRPTGPRLLSGRDMAAIVRRVLGHPVVAVALPFWMLNRAARQQGESGFMVANLRHYLEEQRRGAFEHGAPTDVVLELTGQPAEEFETTARRYAALPYARPTLGNRLRAFSKFSLVPFGPAYNLSRYERDHAHHAPARPLFALDSERWRAEHPAAHPARLGRATPGPSLNPSVANR